MATVQEKAAREAPCRHCYRTVVPKGRKWVHKATGEKWCHYQEYAVPNPPHQCGSRDGLSGCWHPDHGPNL